MRKPPVPPSSLPPPCPVGYGPVLQGLPKWGFGLNPTKKAPHCPVGYGPILPGCPKVLRGGGSKGRTHPESPAGPGRGRQILFPGALPGTRKRISPAQGRRSPAGPETIADGPARRFSPVLKRTLRPNIVSLARCYRSVVSQIRWLLVVRCGACGGPLGSVPRPRIEGAAGHERGRRREQGKGERRQGKGKGEEEARGGRGGGGGEARKKAHIFPQGRRILDPRPWHWRSLEGRGEEA